MPEEYPCFDRKVPCWTAAGDGLASLSLPGRVGMDRRLTRSSTNLGRWPVRCSSLRRRWLSSGALFVRVNQSAISEVLQRFRIAATLCLEMGRDFLLEPRA